ncbi:MULTISPECIES: polysaccharide polymerase [unclassified Janthinobacterium]|uniref:polysaccharide polymerase n=1 Tax=unclassified Janthinobacterium TaxID=2610881 RepID=UPI0016164401|nr:MULTISPECIES: polysaccharide polymerase [unclassified Janthinobacterium]MBB5369723.1 putative polymerase [Janthinobacterium sp. K2C7]MBB5382321.1 putative polymerase [Janthinobacterium sp. K2Li3]MBB5387898.1 putative polymerase [Janthinobacterium sp. K2E3]
MTLYARQTPASLRDAGEESNKRRLLLAILIAATVYQAVLCFVHTHFFKASTALVAFSELCIYAACAVLLFRRIELSFVAILTLIASYLLLLALLRSSLDPKGFRDVIILVLFYFLGRNFGDEKFADRFLKIIVYLVLVVGFFELLFVDVYSKLFNVYSYYLAQGNITTSTNWAEGSTLALNGIRPAGIGRTILPFLLGNHRVSSIFLEPVSFGNFAVIVAAWGLSKDREQWRDMVFFLAAAAIMITLADSRYGLVTVALMVLVRLLISGRGNRMVMVLPFICAVILILFGLYYDGRYSDNIPGRLYLSGITMVRFGPAEIFGLAGYNINFGDMGYSIVLTRFGLFGCAVLWIGLWMIKMRDERGERFRTYIVIYMSLILCISGTSLFALKSAGVLWFLLGCYAVRDKKWLATPLRSAQPVAGKVHYAD